MIRLAEPSFGPEIEALVIEVLRSKRLSQGPMVERFESLCAEMAGVEHAIAMANGTIALEAALEVSGIGAGDEVITTPFTFIATLNSILGTGATVRFADVGPDLNLDPSSVEHRITRSTKMIVPVHLYGLPCDMARLANIAAKRELQLIEDCAQAHGASIQGRPVGSFGTSTFSFYATKNVTAGEGGVVTTSDGDVARELRLLRNQGMERRYKYQRIGRNLRLSELQAAVAIPQMERLAAIVKRRAENAASLSAALEGRVEGLKLPEQPSDKVHAWHQYTVLLPDGLDRARVVTRMHDAGVEVGVYYPDLVWDHPPYRNHPGIEISETPVAEAAARRCLSLPVHPALTDDNVTHIADTFVEAVTQR